MTSDIVTFRTADGTEISNDPRFHARGLAAQMQRQADELRRRQGESQTPPASNLGGSAAEEEDDAENAPLVNYSDWTGKQLKAEAERRELDTSGLTKKSQLIDLLTADDEEEEPEEEESTESEDTDPEE